MIDVGRRGEGDLAACGDGLGLWCGFRGGADVAADVEEGDVRYGAVGLVACPLSDGGPFSCARDGGEGVVC